jgi:hypothetical protein
VILEWQGKALVLGADCEDLGWEAIAAGRAPGNLTHADPVKVPHHGSKEAIHPVLLDVATPRPGRMLVVAPWNRGKTLPRFESGQGAEELLRISTPLRLTTLPFRGTFPKPTMTLAAVRSLRGLLTFDQRGEISVELDGTGPAAGDGANPLDAWVLVQLHVNGSLDVKHGASAVELTL